MRSDSRPGGATRLPSAPPAGPGGDIATDLVPWLLGIAAAVLVPVWAGAALAAWLFGGSARGVSLVDAPQALARLGHHLARPEAAWPPSARSNLPGPVAYWFCQVLVLVAVVGIALALWRLRERLQAGSRGGGALGVEAEAGFACRRDLKRLAVPAPEAGRLTIGRAAGRLIACEPDASLAVVGPTGCGKTAGFAIPALLEWKGPVIATSVKADLLEATIAHRQRQGKVWIYDPTGCSGRPSSRWSPLGACLTWNDAMRMAAWMSEAAQPRLDTVSDGDYWYSQARKGLAPYLYAAAVSEETTLSDVIRWVDTQATGEVEALLLDAARRSAAELVQAEGASDKAQHRWDELWGSAVEEYKNLAGEADPPPPWIDKPSASWPLGITDELVKAVDLQWQTELLRGSTGAAHRFMAPVVAARALWDKEARLRGSVFATMENVLAGWADPGVCATATSAPGPAKAKADDDDGLDLGSWLAGDNTLYVVATAHEQARLRPVLTVLVQQAIRAAYDNAAANGGRLDQPCLVLLDEAGNIAPLRDLPGYASTARSHGITLVSVWQDLAQIRATYRDRSETVLNNHRAKLFGTGIADQSTLEYVSRLIGDEQRSEHNLSADLGGGRRTMSEHRTYRRAAPIDVLRRIRPGEGVLLYGSELPAHVRLRPWFSDGGLREAAAREDLIVNERRSRALLRR